MLVTVKTSNKIIRAEQSKLKIQAW